MSDDPCVRHGGQSVVKARDCAVLPLGLAGAFVVLENSLHEVRELLPVRDT